MKKEYVIPGQIYYVDYDPVEPGEFGNGRHLAVILKMNDDENTYYTVPMTSKCNGMGDVVDLGFLKCLPLRHRKRKSYAVVSQARSISPKRISAVYERGQRKEVVLPEGKMRKLKCDLRDAITK